MTTTYSRKQSWRTVTPPAVRFAPSADDALGLSSSDFIRTWRGIVASAAIGAVIWSLLIVGLLALL